MHLPQDDDQTITEIPVLKEFSTKYASLLEETITWNGDTYEYWSTFHDHEMSLDQSQRCHINHAGDATALQLQNPVHFLAKDTPDLELYYF